MPSYRVDIQGKDELIRGLQRMGKEIESGIERVLDQAAMDAKNQLESNAPSFTGNLKSSININRSGPNERTIGAGDGLGGDYPPTHYIKNVEEGGGPTNTIPNVYDIASRLGVDVREAFAFARYLQRSRKAVRQGSFFVRKTAQQVAQSFNSQIQIFISKVTR